MIADNRGGSRNIARSSLSTPWILLKLRALGRQNTYPIGLLFQAKSHAFLALPQQWHLNHFEAIQIVQTLSYQLDDNDYQACDVSVHPPFTDLRSVQTVLESDRIPVSLGAQHCHFEEKGAFTGAHTNKEGMFQAATGGSLFLDEVGEMPMHLQVKLLRALQERSVRPVGGTSEVPVDVRIIAATNQDLEKAVHHHDHGVSRAAFVHDEVPSANLLDGELLAEL